MLNFPVRTPQLLKWIFPKYIWDNYTKSNGKKVIYLTFDDGPTPEITPWVLDQLALYGAKATFFLVGNNVARNPKLVAKILHGEHTIGNHTYDHLNGWSTKPDIYLDNVKKAEKSLRVYGKIENISNKLFRPPYGKIRGIQASELQTLGYKIVMYDVLARDWDKNLSKEHCFKNVVKNARSGSIVVFHDSVKAELNLKASLPRVLAHYQERGYAFKAL